MKKDNKTNDDDERTKSTFGMMISTAKSTVRRPKVLQSIPAD